MSAGAAPLAGEALALLALLRKAGAVSECMVQGGSMGAAIPDGTEVRIHFDGGAGARTGDAVALWLADEALTVHRLHARGTGRAQGLVVTVGDANLFPEAPLSEEAVLGTVTGVRAPGGEWRPVPPSGERPFTRRINALTTAIVTAALAVHPAVGTAAKGCFVVLMWPIVRLLRPYGADRRPASARLGRA